MIYRNGGTHGALLFECPHTRICATSPACPEYPPTGSAGQPEYPPSRAEPSREIVVIAFSPVLWVPRGDCSQPAPSQLQPAPSSPPVPRQLPASSQPAPSQLPASSRPAPPQPKQFPQNLWSRRCPTDTGLNEWVISNHSPPRKPESGLPGSLRAGEGMPQLQSPMPGCLVPGVG